MTWTEVRNTPWVASHADACASDEKHIYFAHGNGSLAGADIKEAWRLDARPGATVSKWRDMGIDSKDLSQTNALCRPIRFENSFGAQPGVEIMGGEYLSLAANDAGCTNGCFQVYVVGKTVSANTTADTPEYNPPSTLIGTATDAFNQFGMKGGALEYLDGVLGWRRTNRGDGLNDGQPRLLWAQHQSGSLKLGVGTRQLGTTDQGVGFDESYTGWSDLGAGMSWDNKAQFTYGAIVVIPDSAIASTNLTKLNKWAQKWGNISP